MARPLPIAARARRAQSFDRATIFAHRSAVARALAVAFTLPFAQSAFGAPFDITNTQTSARTLASGETGTVRSTGALNVSGSTNAVAITGNNVTLTNLGQISQIGTGRAIRDNTGVSNLVVNNGSATNNTALIQTRDSDVIQMNVGRGSVVFNNYGRLVSTNVSAGGAQVIDFHAITTGANTLNNYAGGVIQSTEADAVRPGVNGVVNNAGTIRSVTNTGGSSDGVDLQANSGIRIHNDKTGLIEGGRHGITGGPENAALVFDVSVSNLSGGTIRGNNGSGINLDGFGARHTATVVNYGSIIGHGVSGDGDGIDADGPAAITNHGLIRSVNAYNAPGTGSARSEGISVGGGTISNHGTIEGLVAAGNTNAVGRGITLAGNDISSGPLAGTRQAIYASSVITNHAGGVIRGQSDSAIAVEGPRSGFTVTINNQAGARITGGGTAAAIRTGGDDDTLTNGGTIEGAVDLGAGNNRVFITGGGAVVTGSINGGTGGVNTMSIDPGAGNRFAYGGQLSNFASVGVASGEVILSGVSTYSGATRIDGGVLTLEGAGRLAAESTLELAGGTLRISGAAGADAQSFSGLSLFGDSSIDLGGAALTFAGLGTIKEGATLTVFNFERAGTGYALRLLGDFSQNADFLGLMSRTTLNGEASVYAFDGQYTNISAVPEPASIAMLLAGLGVIGAARRRRASSAA